MIVAKLYRGPFDEEYLSLPTKEPWQRLVIPSFGKITIEHFYLYSGSENEIYFYLYEPEAKLI